MPYLGAYSAPYSYTAISYRLGFEDYLVPFYAGVRDGLVHELRLQHSFLFKEFDQFVYGGYQFNRGNPSNQAGNDFEFDGHQIEVGARTPIISNAVLEGFYYFRMDNYAFPNSRDPLKRRRDDDIHQFQVLIRKPVAETVVMILTYRGRINHSNIDAFDYTRHIVSLGIQLEF
jgi:hypothetical protein